MVGRRMTLAAVLGVMTGAGCVTTRPEAEVFPGVAAEGVAPHDMCEVREADHIYVDAVGDKRVAQYDVNPVAWATYRRWLLPPGKHVLVVFYREQRNLETVAAGPRTVTLDAQPGAKYELRSGANGADLWFADEVATASWRPEVVDAKSGAKVAVSEINR